MTGIVPDLTELNSCEGRAQDVISVTFNAAKEALGCRQNLFQLADTGNFFDRPRISLKGLVAPFSATSEKFLDDTIRKCWRLTDTFQYYTKFLGDSKDELSQYYYYEAVFSQPTEKYPIPQATVSVFFRIEDKYTALEGKGGVPIVTFHIEGQQSEYDIRYVTLTADWLLFLLQTKLKFFQRIEKLKVL